MLLLSYMIACGAAPSAAGSEAADDTTRVDDPGHGELSATLPVDPPEPRPDGVVIIGAGAAGLAAAIDLPGAIVFEASSAVGGRAAYGTPHLLLVGTEEQAAEGVEDSVELALADWPAMTGEAPCDASRTFVEASDKVRDRLTELGVAFTLEEADLILGRQRLHYASEAGLGLVDALDAGSSEGIDLRLSTPVTGLLLDERGVVGVETADGTIEAGTVIIATGGFANRVDLVRSSVTWAAGTWGIGSDAFANGQALDWAVAYGLSTARLDAVGSNANVIGIAGADGLAIPTARPDAWVWVDSTGERFVNEEASWSLMLATAGDMHAPTWALSTHDLLMSGVEAEHQPFVEAGLTCESDWATLAEHIGVDPDGIEATLAAIDDVAAGRTIDAFGRTMLPDLRGATPCAFPWGRLASKSFGGLAVEATGEVTDGDGRVVPGLYAIGEAAGMAQPGMGGLDGFDGSLSAVIWSGWRTAEAINAAVAED